MESETFELVQVIAKWHENKLKQLNSLIEEEDATIELVGENGKKVSIEPDSEMAKGIRIGCSVAMDILKELPFEIEEKDNG